MFRSKLMIGQVFTESQEYEVSDMFELLQSLIGNSQSMPQLFIL